MDGLSKETYNTQGWTVTPGPGQLHGNERGLADDDSDIGPVIRGRIRYQEGDRRGGAGVWVKEASVPPPPQARISAREPMPASPGQEKKGKQTCGSWVSPVAPFRPRKEAECLVDVE